MTQRLTIAFRQKQLYWQNDTGHPIYVDCDVNGLPTYVDGAVPDHGWTDMTEWAEGLDKLKLSWQATGGESESGSLGSNDLGSNYQKGISLELRFTGPAFQYIYDWLMTNPCQILNAVEVLITDLDCARSYRVFEIKLDNVKYAPFDEPCIVSMVLREKDDTIHAFQKTIIEDDWQGWFNSDGTSTKDHPNFIYIVEKKPQFILSALIVLLFFAGMIQTKNVLFWFLFHDDFKVWAHKILGISFFCPAPLIRTYITNVCDKYGFTFNTMFDDLPQNAYRDLCLFYPVEKFQKDLSDGFTSPDTKFIWDNRTGFAFSVFLDKLKLVFNAEWYITPNNQLVFQPRSYFNTLAPIYDFTLPGAFPLYNFFYEFNGQKKPAYGDYNYRIDPQDTCSNDLKWRYNSIVDFDGPANNPMLEGHITKEFEFGCTSFMYDGATEDWLENSIKAGSLVAILIMTAFGIYFSLLNPIFVGPAIAGMMFFSWWAVNNYLRKFFNNDNLRGAVRASSNVINIPRLLLWDRTTAIESAKVLRRQDPVHNPYYNDPDKTYYEAHPAFDADAGYFGNEVVDIPNYDMVIDEDFFGNLYDRFHESDNPLKNPEVNQNWQGDLDFCCEVGDLLGLWEGDFVKIGAVMVLEIRNNRIISGRIASIAVDYDKGVVHLTGVVLKSAGVPNVITPTCPGDTPAVTDIVNNADGSITITGTATPLTVIKVYGSDTEFGTYSLLGSYTAQNLIDGLIILPESLVSTNQWFKVTSTTTNCNYGFSNAVNHTLAIPCPAVTPSILSIVVSGSDYILTGAGVDGAVIKIFGSATEGGTYTQIGSDHTEDELEDGITFSTAYTWIKIGVTDDDCDYGLSAAANISTFIGADCCTTEDPIFFTSAVASVIVPWDVATKGYPHFQVYQTDSSPATIITVDIQPNNAVPSLTTQFEIFTNNLNGFITITK